MHRFFVPRPFAEEIFIEGTDARHISKVLRMRPGDEVQIVTDDGITCVAAIRALDARSVSLQPLRKLAESHEPGVKITLAQGLAKGEKMEFIIQKAVELGVYSIAPVAMEHSVLQLAGEKAAKKAGRWQKIAAAAAQQSKRDIIPKIQPVMNMEEMLHANPCATKIIAYECEQETSLKKALRSAGEISELLLIIGPEGGISESELELARSAGAVPVSLGRRILRVETAGLAALSAIFYETEEEI